jgi:hypothetical protein
MAPAPGLREKPPKVHFMYFTLAADVLVEPPKSMDRILPGAPDLLGFF